MAGTNHDRNSTSVEILRSELENIQQAETPVPNRPSLQNGDGCSRNEERRLSLSSITTARRSVSERHNESSSHITFPDALRSPNRGPRILHQPDLYPIESRIEEPQSHQEDNVATHDYQDNTRPSRVSFAAPPSVTHTARHPRVRLGGLEKSIKAAAQASETIAHAKDWVARQRARTKRMRRSRTGRVRALVGVWYKRWILEGLLRKRPLPASVDGRHVPVRAAGRDALMDERRGGRTPYVSNFIRSSRYTVWSFLPKQLFFQFSKLANAYFLTIGILQMIPGLSTTGTYTTIVGTRPFRYLVNWVRRYADFVE